MSAISAIKLRLLTQHVAKSILGEPLPEEKLKEIFGVEKNNMDVSKAAIACLRYLMISAVKYNTDSTTFNEELQQLGLPKEHAAAICRVVDEHLEKIKGQLTSEVLSVNEVVEVNGTTLENAHSILQVQFKVKNHNADGIQKSTTQTVSMHKSDAAILLKELDTVYALMKQYNTENKYEETDDKV